MKKHFPYELIGEEMEVLSSHNPSNLEIKGRIVDETKFTLKIKTSKEIKTLFKKNIVFRLKNKNLVLDGKDLVKRPEERLKG
jgi:ribonuclease P protein subunit POP4